MDVWIFKTIYSLMFQNKMWDLFLICEVFEMDMLIIMHWHFFVTCWSCGKLDNYPPLGSSNYINGKRNHVDF